MISPSSGKVVAALARALRVNGGNIASLNVFGCLSSSQAIARKTGE